MRFQKRIVICDEYYKHFIFRYGLPVNFQAMLLHPNKKNTKRLRDVLHQLYGHLDSSAQQGGASGAHDVCIIVKYHHIIYILI